jgi:hypothetical protein
VGCPVGIKRDGCSQEGSLYSLSRFVRAGTEVETRAGRLVPFCHLSLARSWSFPSGRASSATTWAGWLATCRPLIDEEMLLSLNYLTKRQTLAL